MNAVTSINIMTNIKSFWRFIACGGRRLLLRRLLGRLLHELLNRLFGRTLLLLIV